MQKKWISLGLMSGTSGDGVDASIIKTNGIDEFESITNKYFEYDSSIYKNVSSWQKQLGYVSQEIYLLDGSLRDNIGFGIPSDAIHEFKIRSAVERSQLSELIASLPDGLETVVGERGVRLSGGQRQRIGIARALYNNPAVLVLDEATSSLDTASERMIRENMSDLSGKVTLILVAHRLSTVKNVDTVVILEEGTIVETGDPVHLRKNAHSRYSKLLDSQNF